MCCNKAYKVQNMCGIMEWLAFRAEFWGPSLWGSKCVMGFSEVSLSSYHVRDTVRFVQCLTSCFLESVLFQSWVCLDPHPLKGASVPCPVWWRAWLGCSQCLQQVQEVQWGKPALAGRAHPWLGNSRKGQSHTVVRADLPRDTMLLLSHLSR